MRTNKIRTKALALYLSAALSLNTFGLSVGNVNAQDQNAGQNFYNISNPYENVDWATFGQYKSALHSHSTNSDGGQTKTQMVEQHYTLGYDIYAPADHDVLNRDFTNTARTYAAFVNGTNDGLGNMTAGRVAEIAAGAGRNGRGMIGVTDSNEHSRTEHINGFFAPLLIENANALNGRGANAPGRMLETVRMIEEAGGISHINHSGRFTGGSNSNLTTGAAGSNNPTHIKTHVDIFMEYASCVGMEIINRLDNESRSDRILWDNILKATTPNGRFVWGFSNDDSHSTGEVGWNYNMHIMPELSLEAFRESMETGTFFAVAPVARREGVNPTLPGGAAMTSGGGGTATQYLRETAGNPYPRITDINVSGNTISITANDYDVIEWIADGVIIATGNEIDLNDYSDKINSYIRAQVKSTAAIVFVQPFGVSEAAVEHAVSSAFVSVKPGNTNDLTITVAEFLSNGMTSFISETISIRNNAEGVYSVGGYKVFIDTKGNDQIRRNYIVSYPY